MQAVARFDCTAEDASELSFNTGDIIIDVQETADQGWYRGKLQKNGKVGLFPGNYVTLEQLKKPIRLSKQEVEPDQPGKINKYATRIALMERSSQIVKERMQQYKGASEEPVRIKSEPVQEPTIPHNDKPEVAKRPPLLQSNQCYTPPSVPQRDTVAALANKFGQLSTSDYTPERPMKPSELKAQQNPVDIPIIKPKPEIPKKPEYLSEAAQRPVKPQHLNTDPTPGILPRPSRPFEQPNLTARPQKLSQSPEPIFAQEVPPLPSRTCENNSVPPLPARPTKNHPPTMPPRPQSISQSTARIEIPREDELEYDRLYLENHPSADKSRMKGDLVRSIWLRSGLDNPTLGKVWQKIDHTKDGSLSRREFIVGMWLIDELLRGNQLPEMVAECLFS